jgi:spore coat protein CotH
LSAFEKALYSSDYRSASRGYRRYIDVDSFVDYYVLQEFLAISDAGTRSTYLYRDRSGKIKIGPVWDYNNAWNNYFMSFDEEGSEFMLVDRIWYDRLLSDPYFNEKVIERYRELRKTFLSDEALLSEMDEIVDYLGSAVGRNESVWGYAYDPSLLDGNQKLFPDERNPENYESALEQMKEYMRRRGAWMDRHIDSLRQYAHSSRTEKYETR